MLLVRSTRRWQPKRRRVIGAGAPYQPPGPDTGLIPVDATWWYDSSLLSNATRDAINNAPSGPSSPTVVIDLRPDGMPGKIQLKNKATKPRIVHSGTFKGAIRCMRRSVAPFTDPTGGPPDHDDAETLDAAHASGFPLSAADQHVVPAHGQRYDFGYRFRVISAGPGGSGAGGYPNDGDAAAWNSDSDTLWMAIGLLSAGNKSYYGSDTDTIEMVGAYLRHYDAQFGFYPKTSRMEFHTNGKLTEYYDFWGPNGRRTKSELKNVGPGATISWTPSALSSSDKAAPLNFDQWYTVKVECMVAGWDDTRSWANFWLDGVKVAEARGLGIGMQFQSATDHFRIGSYGTYSLYGKRRNFLMDHVWVRLGATGYPGPPA